MATTRLQLQDAIINYNSALKERETRIQYCNYVRTCRPWETVTLNIECRAIQTMNRYIDSLGMKIGILKYEVNKEIDIELKYLDERYLTEDFLNEVDNLVYMYKSNKKS